MFKSINKVLVLAVILSTTLALIYYNTSEIEKQKCQTTEQHLVLSQQREAELKDMLTNMRTDIALKTQEALELADQLRVSTFKTEALREQLVDLRRNYSNMEHDMSELKLVNEMMQDKVKQMITKKHVKLEKIVVNTQNIPQGQIVSVNKNFDFVVIDLGEKDGLKTGAVLSVFKGNDNIGQVQIEKMDSSISAATILPKTDKEKIQTGDAVKPL